ncbi:glycosyltransferase family 4 protein [Candidatus Phycosocius spiralis]|uniref:Glycosyl transferase n=1 Tax=Candidatus Phycosocius spiralis TaxID=2815099 RepID=A0ABQ4PYS8_9PROT|nr:glycosyltransferase family 4 protein [Candidatus Phycosocius spiralis]GIU67824.1 glycosyl transferase [Candidatus Phycosocius spiralis]
MLETTPTLLSLTGKTILQVVPEMATGGVEQTTLEVASAIIAAGGKAIVFSQGGRLVNELEDLGARHIQGPAASKNPWTVFVTNPWRLIKLMEKERIDLVHARSRAPAWSAWIATRWTTTPFVTTYHGIYNAKSGLKRLYNSVMARGDRVIANSFFTQNHVIEEHKTAPPILTVIYRGVDIATFNPQAVKTSRRKSLAARWGISLKSVRPRLILPARLTPWKGQQVLLSALFILHQKGIEFECLMVGDAQGRYEYRDDLNVQTQRLGLSECVHFVGHCNDMAAAFALCDIAITPSIEPEAFGRTAAEAQAMGLPVIASDLGAARETIDPGVTGLLTPAGDAHALASAIEQLIALTPLERKRMGAAGQARIQQKFTTLALQRATVLVYQQLLQARN